MTQTDSSNLEAALRWAERMEQGEIPDRYDPWIVALAQAYREIKTENERLRKFTAIDSEYQLESIKEAFDLIEPLRARVAELEARDTILVARASGLLNVIREARNALDAAQVIP